MIEINLHPGAGKKSKGRGASVNVGAALAGVVAKVKDPYLLAALGAAAAAVLAVGGLHLRQTAEAATLAEQERTAVQDSTKYAVVLGERKKAEARRDSVLRQLDIIKAIDNNRFVWPHVMDEVSRALPPYTWLKSVAQTSAPPAAPVAAPAKDEKVAPDAKDTKPAAPEAPPTVKFRIVGNTVDIQALTRFMKVLEASPFIQNVQLARSGLVAVDGREATEFQLDAEYQTPDSASIRTVPVTLSVR